MIARDWWNIKNSSYDPVAQGANFWVTAMDPAGTGILPADSTNVATWVDKTGVAGNLLQATGGKQPLFLLNQQNGNPGIFFAGSPSSIWMQASVYSAAVNTAAFTLYMVCQPAADEAQFRTVMSSNDYDGVNSRGYFLYATSVADGNKFDFVTSKNTPIADHLGTVTSTAGVSRILTTTMVSGAKTIQVGGTLDSDSSTYVVNGVQALRVGAVTPAEIFFWSGLIFEIIYYPTVRTAIQQRDDRNYLQSNWGNI